MKSTRRGFLRALGLGAAAAALGTGTAEAADEGYSLGQDVTHMAQAHGSQQHTETVWRPHEEA